VNSRSAGGFVITAGQFAEEAQKFVHGLNIKIFDGTHLHKMIRESEKGSTKSEADTLQTSNIDPECPKCGKSMVRRVAKKGKQAGIEFWGCSGFPVCRQTMSC
jgi:restriction system protein